LRLKSSFRYSIYAAFAALFLSGTGWLVADWQKNISSDEIWQQRGLPADGAWRRRYGDILLLLGALIPVNVLRSSRSGNII
jgi:hypothetical protein